MNFDFSDDQKALAESARKTLSGADARAGARAVYESGGGFDRTLWRRLGELGWLGLTLEETHGGAGLGALELCALAEEIGRANAAIPFSSTLYLFAEALRLYGSAAQNAAWAPKIAAGECVGTLALSERPGALAEARITTHWTGDGLHGEKIPVTDGAAADAAIVLAREGDAFSLFLTRLDQPGVTRGALESLDPSRGHARLVFKGAAGERLGAAGEGWAMVQALLDRAAILFAFEQLGGAEAALEMAVSYAKSRYAFGRPIGSYQAIKHKLADMYVKNQLARANAYYGAWALASGAADLPAAAAAARVSASEAFDFAAKENIQTHGGMGFTWAVDAHLYLRRAKHLALVIGAPAVWREKLIRALERRNAA